MRKIGVVLLIGILLFSMSGMVNSSLITTLYNDDFDPLVDIEVTVEILTIRSLEKQDRQLFFKEIIDKNSDPDFYLKIFINDVEFKSDTWGNTKYIYDPDFEATLNVPDDQEFVDIKIQLWDEKDESGVDDRLCDISGGSDEDVEITYSIKTGRWTGDDSLQDSSGYGRLCGTDDGTIYQKPVISSLMLNSKKNSFTLMIFNIIFIPTYGLF